MSSDHLIESQPVKTIVCNSVLFGPIPEEEYIAGIMIEIHVFRADFISDMLKTVYSVNVTQLLLLVNKLWNNSRPRRTIPATCIPLADFQFHVLLLFRGTQSVKVDLV